MVRLRPLSVPHGWSFERGLELIKKAGYDGVKLWLGDVPWFQMSTAVMRRFRNFCAGWRMPSASEILPPNCCWKHFSPSENIKD